MDRLRLGLIRSIAMIDLLLEGWCEPPKPQALHLPTLVHQVLSVIAQQGGAPANILYSVLCREGPFRQVTAAVFTDVLRALGHPETGLIEQTDGGLLLLGQTGERLVEHYSFYAVFKTPEEYRLVSNGRDLGTLPIDNILSPGMMLIFSGRRWLVQEIHDREKVIMVKPAKAGVPPVFGGDAGNLLTEKFHPFLTRELLELDAISSRLEPQTLETLVKAFVVQSHFLNNSINGD